MGDCARLHLGLDDVAGLQLRQQLDDRGVGRHVAVLVAVLLDGVGRVLVEAAQHDRGVR